MNKKTMRQLIFSILIILTISCSKNNNTNSDSPISVKAEIIRTFDSIFEKEGALKTYYLKLSITNIATKPVEYSTMSCAWPNNWMTNMDDYWLAWSMSCNQNIPILIHLKPNEIYTYYAFVCKHKYESTNLGENKLKMGFIFIDRAVCKNSDEFKNFMIDKSLHRIIWSNPIDTK